GSFWGIFSPFASRAMIPPEDIAAGAATQRRTLRCGLNHCCRVFSGTAPPRNAFVAVKYHNHWFWINDGDWRSKRTLSTVLFLFTLTDTETGVRTPVLTIPVK